MSSINLLIYSTIVSYNSNVFVFLFNNFYILSLIIKYFKIKAIKIRTQNAKELLLACHVTISKTWTCKCDIKLLKY